MTIHNKQASVGSDGPYRSREIVVISGKGGTGKTSIVASFAALSKHVVLADCDVDAADLHLVLAPTIRRREEFRCGHEAIIRRADCIGCGACLAHCRFGAVLRTDGIDNKRFNGAKTSCNQRRENTFFIDPTSCEGCGVCVWACPVKAIDFPERLAGVWYVSDTRHGPLVHARLTPGGENSGKLVSKVREIARTLAKERSSDLVLVDGPPGVGCAVIAAVSGASQVLIVTEPTLSGAHDMARVLELTRHFNIPAAVCVNKWDLNAEMTARIESQARSAGAALSGRLRYDPTVTRAQVQGRAVVEVEPGPIAGEIRAVWEHLFS